jgi:GTP-binding protein LepA
MFREFNLDVIMTSPQVTYKCRLPGDKTSEYSRLNPRVVEMEGYKFTYIDVSNPEDLPKRELYTALEEPIAKCEIITPTEFVGALMQLSQERR